MRVTNFSAAKVKEVIEVSVTEGKGIEGSPYRRVVYYVEPDGKVLARYDEWEEKASHVPA